MQFCSRCGLSTKLTEQYTEERDLEIENKQLKLEIGSIHKEINEKFNSILSLISDNPKLVNLKSDILEKIIK